jgi:hypothetical protein
MDELERAVDVCKARLAGLIADRAAGKQISDYTIAGAAGALRDQEEMVRRRDLERERKRREDESLPDEERHKLAELRRADREEVHRRTRENSTRRDQERVEAAARIQQEVSAASWFLPIDWALRAAPWVLLLLGLLWVVAGFFTSAIDSPTTVGLVGYLLPALGAFWLFSRAMLLPSLGRAGADGQAVAGYVFAAPPWGLAALFFSNWSWAWAGVWFVGAAAFIGVVFWLQSR